MSDPVFTEDNRREPYVGEKRRFLRDGYGTYVFENKFFKYEGEWMKGKKHGHGKLMMKDGTYYEGQFVNGEINGHGYKYFSSSQSRYTGQFLNGEMHGHGIMSYINGNVYEGQWYKNKKQGFGILRTGERAVYEGSFLAHVREGEGTQTYDPTYRKLSNGDKYEGYWLMDQRHGHGELWMADGSHYVGQFKDDMFNGEGVMDHASGIVYRGIWINGFPITMATKLVLVGIEENPLIIRQGQPFAIRVECRNDNDELVKDQGRELQVMAGFKYRAPKEGSALFDVIEDVEDKPIPTPFHDFEIEPLFDMLHHLMLPLESYLCETIHKVANRGRQNLNNGYDVVPYPLTDIVLDMEVPEEETDGKADGAAKAEDEGEDKGDEDNDEEPADEGAEPKEAMDDQPDAAQAGDDLQEMPPDSSPRATPMEQGAAGQKQEENTPLLPPVASLPTRDGISEWNTLQLAPPPPMYRPFVIMEEEAGQKKKSRIAQMKEKMDDSDSEDGAKSEEDEEEGNEKEEGAEDETRNPETGENLEEKEEVDKNEKGNGVMTEPGEENIEAGDLERKNSVIQGLPSKQGSDAEKTLVKDEKIARTGEYVLMVQDVTNPPFMGRTLEPAFLLLKLKRPKRIIVKKPNPEKERWDTQRHIAMSMSRSNSLFPES